MFQPIRKCKRLIIIKTNDVVRGSEVCSIGEMLSTY